MNRHLSAERLSVYLDDELDGEESSALEGHLAQCAECRQRLSSLRRVVLRLNNLERAAPPPIMGQLVLSRMVEEGREAGALQRMEARLRGLPNLQPAVMVGFALVFALAVISLLFLQKVDENQQRSVPVVLAPQQDSEPEAIQEVGDRTFALSGQVWRETGIADDASRVEIGLRSLQGQAILSQEPWIEALLVEGNRVVLRVGTQVVELYRDAPE